MQRRRVTRVEQREQTRELLLDAAVEVFSRRGYHGASVDEVAETAGFSKGAVYSNFASKEELFLALFDRRLEKQIETWPSIGRYIAPTSDPRPTNERGFEDAIAEDRTWNVLLVEFFLYAMRDERVRQTLATRLVRLRSLMAEHLAIEFAARGVVPRLPIENLPWAISALGMGLIMQVYLDPAALPANLYESTLEQLLS